MKVAALFSGGKDSVFAVYITQQYGWDVSHLVTLHSRETGFLDVPFDQYPSY